jgi:hypothetical protein
MKISRIYTIRTLLKMTFEEIQKICKIRLSE